MSQHLAVYLFRTFLTVSLMLISNQVMAGYFPVFDSSHQFVCSSLSSVGCSGLFPIHPKKDSSEIALLTNGESSFLERLRTLENAKRSIRIQALVFKGDESGLKIAEVLKRKRADGLDVRVIVDGFSNPDFQTQTMYFDLKENDIEVEGFEAGYLQWVNEISLTDSSLINKRFHEKTWIIDGEEDSGIAITGGMNIANEYFRIGQKPKDFWRDQDTIVKGPIVKDVVTSFERNYQYFKELKASRPALFNTDYYWKGWNLGLKHCFKELFTCLGGKLNSPKFKYTKNEVLESAVERVYRQALANSQNHSFEPSTLRFFQNRPRFEETYIHQLYIDQIRAAKKEIIIANAYFFPSDQVIEELRAAADRGVEVFLLTNSKETNDVPAMSAGARYYYLDLMQSKTDPRLLGLRVFEWEGDRFGEGTLHAKFTIFDRVVSIVGSYNLDIRSQKLNSETVMVFQSKVKAAELLQQFYHSDLQKSHEISLEEAREFHNINSIDKIIEYVISKKFKGQL